jgi:dienelactone hydrolase
MKQHPYFFSMLMGALLLSCLLSTTSYSQVPLKGLLLSGDPASCNGATWTYKDTVDGVVYDLRGILFKPYGPGPFPAVILSHGDKESVAGSPTALSNTMVTWGLVCISTNLTHCNMSLPLGAPGTWTDKGASNANILRAHKCRDILANLGYVDTNYVAAHGYSLGAFTSAALVGLYPLQFKVASHASGGIGTGAATTELQASTIITPYQIHHGIPDATVPLAWDVALNDLLQAHSVPTQLYTYEGYQHTDFSSDNTMLRRIKEWYTQNGLFTLVPVHIGTVLRVPQEYSTIQAAIDAAQSLDTVLVSEGRYYENIRYKRKGIVIASKYFMTKDWQTVSHTIIDGSQPTNIDTAAAVQFLNYEDSTNVLDGFTITGGTGILWNGSFTGREGGGIILSGSAAIIKNNMIINNRTEGSSGGVTGGGGGISSMYGDPTISNNIIASNTSGYAGGLVLNWSKGKIRNNIIYHNACMNSNWGGGGVMIWQAPKRGGIVENNTIIGNATSNLGGGIRISISDALTAPNLKNNLVWGNSQGIGGQIDLPQYSNYGNVEDYSSAFNISVRPQLQKEAFLLSPTSPCIDAGDPSMAYNDIEDPSHSGIALSPSQGLLRNDIGATGGPFAKMLTSLDIIDFRLSRSSISTNCYTGQTISAGVELLNTGTISMAIDSVTHTDTSHFSLDKTYAGRVLDFFQSDSIKIIFRPLVSGIFYDTLKVFHHVAGKTSPAKIIVSGSASDYTLTVNVTHGTVNMRPPGGAYSYGTPVTVTLTEASGYRFMQWTGDVPVGHETENPITLIIDANKTLGADFANTCVITSNAGWNLVSVPLLQSNSSANVIFPHKDGNMYMFSSANQSYFSTETLANGLGYWIYYQNPDTSTMCGYIAGPMTVPAYKAGWVLIGSRHTSVAVNELQVTDGMIYGDAFRYNHSSNSYDLTTMINPGEAAWIYVTKACTITIP